MIPPAILASVFLYLGYLPGLNSLGVELVALVYHLKNFSLG